MRIRKQEVAQALSSWKIPEFPSELSTSLNLAKSELNIKDIAYNISTWMRAKQVLERKAELELAVLNWLYELVKLNVKRGRVFLLKDVLIHRQADCLGYAKLLNRLGREFALDTGIIEVIIDNDGRYTPHYINIVKLSSGKLRFVDLWYGSKDIRHRRIGAEINEGGEWHIKDLYWEELENVEDVRGLPLKAVNGITYYIIGNRHLEKGIREASKAELSAAIRYYTKAIRLYSGYARAYFNRAVAYENLGEQQKAELDYALALRDEASQIRVLAREHADVTELMELDRANITLREQEIFLLAKGFITGEQLTLADVAKHYGIPEEELARMIATIETRLSL